MYLQESLKPVVYRFTYSNNKGDLKVDGDRTGNQLTVDTDKPSKYLSQDNNQAVKSFLEPNETTFANIRRKLSTLSLTTEYKKEQSASPPMFTERKHAPRRISSLSSQDAYGRKLKQKKRRGLASGVSFHSDDREYRIFQENENDSPRKNPQSSESDSGTRLLEAIITPRQHPELFSHHIKSLAKSQSSRATSPKSSRSIDSSGKVHLGLIESLDLTEQLNDVEKIKQRYSGDYFTKSLSLYKARGHDRCFNHSGITEHVPRGTRLLSPDSMRSGSKLSFESAQTMSSYNAPFSSRSPHIRLTPMVLPHQYMQDANPLHVQGFQQATPNTEERDNHQLDAGKKVVKKVRRKSVGFNMVPTEAFENSISSNNSSPREGAGGKELKSILKKKAGRSKASRVEIHEKEGDEFHANANYYWNFQLPRLQSPAPAAKVRQATHFRKQMYHYGQGISDEFEQVVNSYGNCRQSSMVRDPSIIRETSLHKT